MNLGPILVVFVLIFVPSAAGAYLMVRDIGRRSVSTAGYLVLYGVLLAGAIAYLTPQGYLVAGNFLIKSPAILLLSLAFGVVAGVIARRKKPRDD